MNNPTYCHLVAEAKSVFYATDPTSGKKGPLVYAPRGTRLAIISDHGEVLIVEDGKGNRFPVHSSKTTAK